MLEAGLLCLPLLATAAPEPRRLAEGVYVLEATDDEPTPANGGFTANGGFFVGTSGVVVVNPGPSRAAAEALETAIARVTPQPVVLVIDTHARPEQALGSGHFSSKGVPVLAHPDTARLMKERCKNCLAALSEQVGKEAMAGTAIALPQPALGDRTSIGLSGLRLWFMAPERAMMPGNTAVLDQVSGVLFTGVLVSLDHIPDLRDADPDGLAKALDLLAEVPAKILVPDRGPPSAMTRIKEFRRYISRLQEKVEAAYRAGLSLAEVGDASSLPEFAGWRGYATRHPMNARALYQRLEKTDFESR